MLIQKQDVQQVANAMMNMLREDEIELINGFYDAVKAKLESAMTADIRTSAEIDRDRNRKP